MRLPPMVSGLLAFLLTATPAAADAVLLDFDNITLRFGDYDTLTAYEMGLPQRADYDRYVEDGMEILGPTRNWDSYYANYQIDLLPANYELNGSGIMYARSGFLSPTTITLRSVDGTPFLLESMLLVEDNGSGSPGADAVVVEGFFNGVSTGTITVGMPYLGWPMRWEQLYGIGLGRVDTVTFVGVPNTTSGQHDWWFDSISVERVPEPATGLLLALGLALAARRRRL